MAKRNPRAAFSPGVVFDDKRTKLRKVSLAKMIMASRKSAVSTGAWRTRFRVAFRAFVLLDPKTRVRRVA